MTQQKTRILVAALVVAALLLMIAIAGDVAGMPNNPLVVKAEGAAAPREGRGVTASTATLLAGSLGLAGVVIGLFGDRYLRHRGTIRCKPSEWSLTITPRPPSHRGDQNPRRVPKGLPVHLRKRVLAQATEAGYGVRVKLFNETEVATGLRDIRVVFTDDSGAEQKVYLPTMVPTMKDSQGFTMDPDAINLPARQWVTMVLDFSIEPKDFEALAQSTAARLKAWLPMDKPFERRLSGLWD